MPAENEIYLDYNATHPLLPSVRKALGEAFTRETESGILGNASSTHAAGRRSKKLINELKMALQKTLNAPIGEWILYSGATEALNAVLNTAECHQWMVLASGVEHSAVYETLGCSEKKIPVLPVTRSGLIDLEGTKQLLQARKVEAPSVLVFAVQAHNNETGVNICQPETLKGLRSMGEEAGYEVKILLDGVQSLGKAEPELMSALIQEADYAVFSGHKMGALMGVGALWKRSATPLKSYPTGGGQEKGLRAGTEAIWCVLSWVEALKDWKENGAQYRQHMQKLKERCLSGVKKLRFVELVDACLEKDSLPSTVALIAREKGSDFYLQKLDIEGVLVSGGSACRSGVNKGSHVLSALGFSEEESRSLMRISFGSMSTEAEIDRFLEVMREVEA